MGARRGDLRWLVRETGLFLLCEAEIALELY